MSRRQDQNVTNFVNISTFWNVVTIFTGHVLTLLVVSKKADDWFPSFYTHSFNVNLMDVAVPIVKLCPLEKKNTPFLGHPVHGKWKSYISMILIFYMNTRKGKATLIRILHVNTVFSKESKTFRHIIMVVSSSLLCNSLTQSTVNIIGFDFVQFSCYDTTVTRALQQIPNTGRLAHLYI